MYILVYISILLQILYIPLFHIMSCVLSAYS